MSNYVKTKPYFTNHTGDEHFTSAMAVASQLTAMRRQGKGYPPERVWVYSGYTKDEEPIHHTLLQWHRTKEQYKRPV